MTKETFVRAHELAEQISSTRWYDFDVCKEFCELAGMNERWNQLVAIDVIPATIPDENDEAYPKFGENGMRLYEGSPITARAEYMIHWQADRVNGSDFDLEDFEDMLFAAAEKLGVEIK